MEEILEELKTLSLEDIRQQLIDKGENVGPLMPTMRHLFEKKLARRIMRERGLVCEEDEVALSSEQVVPSSEQVTPSTGQDPSTGRQAKEISNADEFFAISLPQGIPSSNCERLVFTSRKEAMSVMKKLPGSRFKKFPDMESAKAFTSITAEEIVQSPRPPASEKAKDEKKSEQRNYKEPTRGERIGLKNAVENGDLDVVKSLIWHNPHYLISIGESPVILHEAFRYNSLHLAAKFNQAEVASLLLRTISNPDFHQLLFADDSPETRRNRIEHLLDLFLNMPDKGGGESPLHFACKFGNPDVVEILVKFPQCDRNLRNKMGNRPYDVINTRAKSPDDEVGERIRKLLEGMVYVPLYRAIGNLPVVGQWLPEIPPDPSLKAYAGPMSVPTAQEFHHSWTVFPPNSPQQKQREIRQTKRSDYDKGLERLGRNLAEEYGVCWAEYWEFLHDFLNLRTPDGLRKLENYLAKCSRNCQDLNGNQVSELKIPTGSHSDGRHGDGCHGDESPSNGCQGDDSSSDGCQGGDSPSNGCQGDESRSNLPQSPMSQLASDFERLKLNDSASSDGTPCRTLLFDDDSDSDSDSEFVSAPSSPSQPVTTATACNHGDGSTQNESWEDESENEEFEDANEQTLVPSFSTPIASRNGDKLSDDVIFLEGNVPSKLDLDVLRAVGDVSVKQDVYPYFTKWRRSVTSYSAAEQSQWPSPARVRRLARPLPQSPLATPPRLKTTSSRADESKLLVKSKLVFE